MSETTYKLTILDIKPDERNEIVDGATVNEKWLDVRFSIISSDESVEERSLGFPIDISKEELTEELVKYLATYKQEKEMAEINRKVDEENKNAVQLKEGLVGEEIS